MAGIRDQFNNLPGLFTEGQYELHSAIIGLLQSAQLLLTMVVYDGNDGRQHNTVWLNGMKALPVMFTMGL